MGDSSHKSRVLDTLVLGELLRCRVPGVYERRELYNLDVNKQYLHLDFRRYVSRRVIYGEETRRRTRIVLWYHTHLHGGSVRRQ